MGSQDLPNTAVLLAVATNRQLNLSRPNPQRKQNCIEKREKTK